MFGDLPLPAKFFIAFVIVLALIGGVAWLVRRFGAGGLSASNARGRQTRLGVIEATAVDSRRRLVLVRRDNVEHLIMLGGPTDLVVEANIVRAQAAATRDAPAQRPPKRPVGRPSTTASGPPFLSPRAAPDAGRTGLPFPSRSPTSCRCSPIPSPPRACKPPIGCQASARISGAPAAAWSLRRPAPWPNRRGARASRGGRSARRPPAIGGGAGERPSSHRNGAATRSGPAPPGRDRPCARKRNGRAAGHPPTGRRAAFGRGSLAFLADGTGHAVPGLRRSRSCARKACGRAAAAEVDTSENVVPASEDAPDSGPPPAASAAPPAEPHEEATQPSDAPAETSEAAESKSQSLEDEMANLLGRAPGKA